MSLRTRIFGVAFLTGLSALILAAARADEPAKKDPPKAAERPKVEVVFCLDTTGSMSGLINAAKQKVWAICNQISAGTPTPFVKVGLLAYRDRNDAYVTKLFDLSDDLDTIYGHLMAFQAQGGGDEPEAVHQALNECVTKMTWSTDKKTLKMVFLVGDAPAKIYNDEPQFEEICKLAVKNDIIINTVQCGGNPRCKDHWEKICRAAEGSYVQIDQNGGPVLVTATPFDKDLAKINEEISKTTVVFGSHDQQVAGKAQSKALEKLDAPAAADRAAFYARNSGGGVAYDLLTNIQQGKVKLADLKDEQLPPEMRKLTVEGRQKFLQELESRRKDLSAKAVQLDQQRNTFLQTKQKEAATQPDGFDANVLRILQRQAGRNNIQYAVPETKAPESKK